MRLFVQVAQLQGSQETEKYVIKGSTSKNIYENGGGNLLLLIKNHSTFEEICLNIYMY